MGTFYYLGGLADKWKRDLKGLPVQCDATSTFLSLVLLEAGQALGSFPGMTPKHAE